MDPEIDIRNRTVMVTGATSGIGRCIPGPSGISLAKLVPN